MSKHPQFPTPIQDLALSLTFVAMGERRFNRSYDEYMAIAAKLPPLKVLLFKINQLLQQLHKCTNECNGVLQLCRFKAGDKIIKYEPYPKSISYETLREALAILGMRERRWQKS